MKFEDYPIHPGIKKSLHEMGFVRPTDIQYKAIPSILKGEDVLAVAQTGTGKTAAFAIPVIHLLQERKKKGRQDGVQCVVMVPTHELAIQLTEVFQQISQNTRVTTLGIFGGVDQDPQIAKLEKGVDILIATPGRLFDLKSQGHLRLNRVDTLILDEADHMLNLGFIKDIQDLIRVLPRRRQTLFFSATIDRKIKKLAYSMVRDAIRIQISPKDPVAKNINHNVAFIEMDHKRFFLERAVTENPESKFLVFVRTKVRAERVMKAMERVGIKSLTFHGDKEQKERLAVLNQFKEGSVKMLIATDVSARGIDVPDVDFVVNYDMPEQAENYVHRVGRTGRGRKKGEAISFCSSGEKPLLEDIEAFTGSPIPVFEIDKLHYKDTLNIEMDRTSDLEALMRQVEEEKNRKKKRK
ncbi:MAG TPA: DEAD/DEAH box helicase [Saprospiraceae bacterium]|nr:DEAD/DEAH box helicase [Saprospiraceae bacterium]